MTDTQTKSQRSPPVRDSLRSPQLLNHEYFDPPKLPAIRYVAKDISVYTNWGEQSEFQPPYIVINVAILSACMSDQHTINVFGSRDSLPTST